MEKSSRKRREFPLSLSQTNTISWHRIAESFWRTIAHTGATSILSVIGEPVSWGSVTMETRNTRIRIEDDDVLSASALLYPARHFSHPRDVINAMDLSVEEKRAVLASWASDAYAVESMPSLRMVPGVPEPIPYDDVLSALKALDDTTEA
jgi:hypothetical protein